jgi:hypothetical protein
MDRSERRLTDTHTHVLTLEVVGRSEEKLEVEVAFEYSACEPFAVALVFLATSGTIRWTMARELLADGLLETVGLGDVHAWPSLDHQGRAVLLLELCGADGTAILLQCRAREIARFLDASYAVVPRGTESELVDLDGLVEEILASADQRG